MVSDELLEKYFGAQKGAVVKEIERTDGVGPLEKLPLLLHVSPQPCVTFYPKDVYRLLRPINFRYLPYNTAGSPVVSYATGLCCTKDRYLSL